MYIGIERAIFSNRCNYASTAGGKKRKIIAPFKEAINWPSFGLLFDDVLKMAREEKGAFSINSCLSLL